MYEKYEDQTTKAGKCDPLSAHAWHRLAEAATFASDSTVASYAFDQAARLVGTPAMNLSVYELYHWGLEMYAPKWGGNPVKFAQVADAASKADYATPGEALSILNSLSNYGFRDKRRDMILRLLDESAAAIQKDPRDIHAHYLHGMVLEQQGCARMATPDFEANVKAYPTNAALYIDLGQHYGRVEQPDLAEAAFRKASDLRPNDPSTLAFLGWSLRRQGKLSDAEQVLKQCLVIAPNYNEAFPVLATVYRMQKRYELAIPLFEKFLQIFPYHEESNVGLAICYDEVHHYNEALRVAERYHNHDPDDIAITIALEDIYIRVNRLSESETLSRDCIKDNSRDDTSRVNLGEALARQGKLAEAHQNWEQVVRSARYPEDIAEAERLMKQFPLK